MVAGGLSPPLLREYNLRVLAGGSIKVPEGYDDLTIMWEWMERQHTLALDLETTGLDIYSDGFRIRLVALATPTEAYVYPEETLLDLNGICVRLAGKRLIMHNGFGFDIPALARVNPYTSIESLSAQTRDTKIIAHQLDPRGREEGGVGQALEDLLLHYVPECVKFKKELKAEYLRLRKAKLLPKGAGVTDGDMYRYMPIDNEMYLIYAGIDAIGTARLFKVLQKQVDVNSELTRNDHRVAMIASLMDAKGFLLDQEYTQNLADQLFEEEERQKDIAWEYGLENINSNDQVYQALIKRGIEITGVTKKGHPQVDKNLFSAHADDPLVHAIVEGKRAGKWRKTWVEKFLAGVDSNGRVHPSTNTLRARTARFSITGIPAQTLPSSDSLIRSCFVSDIGEHIVGVDYANQELRFAAAKAPDARMIQAFRNGENLHKITAAVAFPGMDVSKGTPYYDLGKMGNFAVGYGAGVQGLVNQGMTREQAVAVRNGIKKAYKGMSGLSERLQAQAKADGYITTWTGRRLPVDEGREYAAFNYYIQSGCRDLTGHAMMRLYDAGYVEHMRLPIHDEILFSLPHDEDMVLDVVRLMGTTVGPLEIPAEAKIGSRSWGSLYEMA
jgi:DNA polymerase I